MVLVLALRQCRSNKDPSDGMVEVAGEEEVEEDWSQDKSLLHTICGVELLRCFPIGKY